MGRAEYESLVPPYRLLLAGHFHETSGYRVRRSHGAGDWLLVLTTAGEGRFGYAGGEAPARPGDATLLAPGTPHDYGVAPGAGRWDLLWAHFLARPHWREWIEWPKKAPGLMQLALAGHAEYADIEARFEETVRRWQAGDAISELLAMTALEEVLIGCHAVNPLLAQAKTDPRVDAAIRFIREHICEPISLPALAQAAGLSPSRLGRIFRAQTERTPQQYVEEVRLQAAMQLLDLTNRPVAAIAQSVGFESAFYFSLRFKRATGMSPSVYRNRLNAPQGDA